MQDLLNFLIGLPLGIWAYLILFRGYYWVERPKAFSSPDLASWPEVAAIIPARDEADVVGRAVRSVLSQDYAGKLTVILIDDGSSDGTAEAARQAAQQIGCDHRLIVEPAKSLPKGWTGKLWAVRQGVDRARRIAASAKYLWLTDADIHHEKGVLAGLVGLAEERGLALTSLMAKLRTETLAERALIPAYVYFFQMLYPFAWVNDKRRHCAAAAGGCMLARADALRTAGGIDAIKAQLIDDCALARVLKKVGPIWLGLAAESHSLRGYADWRAVWRLIARSAFTQLRRSLLLLFVCALGLTVTFLAPPALTLSTDSVVRAFGLMSWATMTLSFIPTLRYYGTSVAWAPLLPLIALFYLGATLDSARRHYLGRGGEWKGRWQARGTA